MPYKDPAKRKAYKHAYYIQHKQETLERVKRYRKGHPEMVKSTNRKYNQKRNAPYHNILDSAGVERVCCECGSTDYVCTHHIDGNHNNNKVENLVWMCIKCHGRLHRKQQLESK